MTKEADATSREQEKPLRRTVGPITIVDTRYLEWLEQGARLAIEELGPRIEREQSQTTFPIEPIETPLRRFDKGKYRRSADQVQQATGS